MLESLFNKVAGIQTCNFIKKKLQHMCFPVNVEEHLRMARSDLQAAAPVLNH